MEKMYTPSDDILKKYADVMINFALNGGRGIKAGEVALINIPECAKPFLKPLYETILEAGGHPIVNYIPDGISRTLFEKGSDEQINFFPEKMLRGKVDEINHWIRILSDEDPKEMAGIDPKKLMARQVSHKPFREWIDKKENDGKLSWTLCLYATPKMAEEANLSLEDYWEQIIKACYLEDENPVETWKNVQKNIDKTINWLDNLKIEFVNIKSENTDLNIRIGDFRKWLGGRGCNIPSFEIFTSPDYRYTNGFITFTEPLYRYGDLIEGIRLEFEKGKITKATAKKNEKLLLEMISQKNADRLGEFSLTDRRFSNITKFMAETLFDENVGGENGNTHIAIGKAFSEAYSGDIKDFDNIKDELGFNDSVIHTDIVSTENRVVTATTFSGQKIVIYKNGQFQN